MTPIEHGGGVLLDAAASLLVGHPPNPHGTVAPPPVVLGDPDLVKLVVNRLVIGWREIGQRFPIHVVSSAGDPVDAARAVRAAWRVPDPKRATIGEGLTIVAFTDAATSDAMAAELRRAMPKERIVCVEGTAPISRRRALVDALLHELCLWPGATVVGRPVTTDDGRPAPWNDQPDDVRARTTAVVNAMDELLSLGGLAECSDDQWQGPVLVPPTGVRRMAERLDALSGSPRTNRPSASALELAGRLAAVAARAGYVLRLGDDAATLTDSEVDHVARLAHEGYLATSASTGNATGSTAAERMWAQLPEHLRDSNRAQIADIPVKLAWLGWQWARLDSEDEDARLPERIPADALEPLAEMEHRRWSARERRVGRPNHQWDVPWDLLPDGVRDYDRAAVLAIPGALSSVGLGLRTFPLDT